MKATTNEPTTAEIEAANAKGPSAVLALIGANTKGGSRSKNGKTRPGSKKTPAQRDEEELAKRRAAKAAAKAKEPKEKKPPRAPRAPRPPKTSAFLKDPRLPAAGEVLKRTYKDKEFLVKVCDDGLEYEGQKYRSLSAIARKILIDAGAPATTQCNGYLWFGLVERKVAEVKTAPAYRRRGAPKTARKPRAK